MKAIFSIITLFFSFICCKNNSTIARDDADANIRIIKNGLNYPWEIIWGKDNNIWMTERGGRISSVDPTNGKTVFSFTIKEVESVNEGGLLGLALHPDFMHNHFLFVAYNYRDKGNYKEKLVRYTYVNNALSNPFVLLDGIQGSSNHNGSRLWITNESTPKIFMSTGDAFNQELPQQINTLNGKILRLNLDGTIPADNPFHGNPVWSCGHRNPQGLVMVKNILYESEHGPDIEDEVNIIEKGRNYGWPDVKGPCDGNEIAFCKSNNVKEPIWSSGNATLAICGLDYYNDNRIPELKNSLLLTTLKNSSLRQLVLSNDCKSVIAAKTYFENKWGRLRDLCISPDGKVYICTSNGGNSDVIVEISEM